MKATNKGFKSRYFILAVIGLIVILLSDTYLIRIEYNNYQEKIKILSYMIEGQFGQKDQDNLSIASELLKGGKDEDHQYGRALLKSYGYLSKLDNEYSRQYKRNIFRIGIVTTILYIGFILSMYLINKLSKKKRSLELNELEKILIDFRNGIYTLLKAKELSNREDDISRIYIRMESIADYLLLMEERMTKEREETKSLVTDISHQLKTPVAALKTCFEILQQEDLEPEEYKEFAERYNLQMKGLEDLLAALINISRLEIGMIQIKREEGCIYDTLVTAVNRVYLRAEEKQINIEIVAEDHLQKLLLMHDRKWLCEAFINILDNAIKYSSSDTSITINLVERTSFLCIEIRDQGPGIPKEEYHLIFKRFYRGKSDIVKRQTGSGVGLYLTREIINKHEGTITVASVPGKGSTFTIQLPYKS